MAAVPASGRSAPGGVLSIGQVLARLAPEFPKLTPSKVRFLEDQGIVTPMRAESGYRKYTPAHLERLRLGLTLQRDHYLPLSVIRDYLDELDEGRDPAPPSAVPPSIVPAARTYRREEALSASGAAPQLLNDAVSTGLIPASDTYGDEAVALLRSLVALDRHGIEPRHLRSLRQGVEREASLIESALAALLRRTDAGSRGRAGETASELAKRLDDVRAVYMRAALERIFG